MSKVVINVFGIIAIVGSVFVLCQSVIVLESIQRMPASNTLSLASTVSSTSYTISAYRQ